MFTGLIESVGSVRERHLRGDYFVMKIESRIPAGEIEVGESIACNGACLTVVTRDDESFTVEISQETVSRVAIDRFQINRRINLERALPANGRLGGHFVSGHIDCTGTVDYLKPAGESLELAVKYDSHFDPLVLEKGSIAVDGVSLTINRCRPGWFSVNLIPHTANKTVLGQLRAAMPVNLEFDMIGKYVVKLLASGSRSGLTVEKLLESGW